MSQLLNKINKEEKNNNKKIKTSFKNREKASSFNINNTSNIYMYVNTNKNNILEISLFLLPSMFTISHVRKKKINTEDCNK